MPNKTCTRLMMVFVLSMLTFLSACNYPNPNPPTIGCSVPELIDAINAANANPDHDIIVLTESCNYELSETYFEVPDPNEYSDYGYSGLPPITSPITITGNGSRIFRLDAPSTPEFRIFYIGSSGSLALVELYLENGYVTGLGGAVFVDGGTLTLNQCVLMDNHGWGGGGAIANQNGQVVLTDTVLRHNSAASGGAINNHNGSVDIDFDSVLDYNEATYEGGAVRTSAGDLTIYNSTIRENSAGWDGGGIIVVTGTSTLHGVIIENNQAGWSGGGVHSANASLLIYDSQIRQNQARWGGGFSVEWRDVSITQGTRISNNVADEYGGGIYILGTSTVALDDCSIADNQAGSLGGGIGQGHDQYDPTISMSNCTVSGNSANDFGGGIYINSGEWEINTSTISDNSADEGGGIYNQGRLFMHNSTISMNQAQRGGGILHDAANSVANLSFVTIAENTATIGGGLLIDETWVQITNSLVARNAPTDCQGSIVPFYANLDGDGSCGFEISGDPLLEPLADNGGPTHTHAIPSFSPAAEKAAACTAIDPMVLVSVDQRGEPRPQGAACDLGAYEAELSALQLPPLDTPTATATSDEPLGPGGIIDRDTLCWMGPGPLYNVVQSLKSSEDVDIVGVGAPEGWLVVDSPRYPGLGCWVEQDIFRSLNPDMLSGLPVLAAPAPPASPTPPLVCTQDLREDECKESGGTWSLGAYPPCACP